HHIVDPPQEPEVALVVALGTVACEVHPREAAPVGLLVPLGVAVDAAKHPRPWSLEDEVAAATERDAVPVTVDHIGLDARERERGTPRFRGGHAGEWRDEDLPGLGLPPRVDDRSATAADVLVIPEPRLGVDRLTHRAEDPQRREIVLGRE